MNFVVANEPKNRKKKRHDRSIIPFRVGIVVLVSTLLFASLATLSKTDYQSQNHESANSRSLENVPPYRDQYKNSTFAKQLVSHSFPSQKLIEAATSLQGITENTAIARQNPHGGAFVHIGKTGGSTLSILLRNGCHSFMKHPCREISTNESMASKLIESYYHVPDFGLLRQSDHDFYLITLRDPFDRTISAFVYDHVANRLARNDSALLKYPIQKIKAQEAFKCFPTLQDFVDNLGEDSNQFQYPYPRAIVVADSCTDLARAALHGHVKFFGHFYFSMERILSFLPQPERRTIYVTRQEYLWNDWKTVNEHLGQTAESIYIPEKNQSNNRRNSTALELRNQLPVKRNLNDDGRRLLCQALQSEYKAYLWFLNAAKNLNTRDKQSSMERARQNCPNLDL